MKKEFKKRIVVTGASGYIGSILVEKLLSKGFKNIAVLNRGLSKFGVPVKNFRGDFGDKEVLEKIIKEDDTVIHLACSSNLQISQQDIEEDIEVNIKGSIRLLQVCADKKINKFIYISSGGVVYGDHGESKLKEDDETNPISSYGVMKLSIEKYVQLFGHLYDMNHIIIRPGNPYGKRNDTSKNQGLIDIFIKKIINDEDLEIWGDGEIIRDYIYIDDLVELIIKTLDLKIKNEIFNAGTGIGKSINDILEIIEEESGKKIKRKYLDCRGFDVKCNVLDVKKAKLLLDWSPCGDLSVNINKIIKENTNNS